MSLGSLARGSLLLASPAAPAARPAAPASPRRAARAAPPPRRRAAAAARASTAAAAAAAAAAPAPATMAAGSVSGRMAELRAAGRTAFIPFLVACDPTPAATVAALRALDAAGADVIELGVPYSDPLADGPTIQAAATRALAGGATLDAVLAVVAEAAPAISAPLVMFTYYNPIMARGLPAFCAQAKAAGAAGLLVPDLPLEETPAIRAACVAAGLELVLLTTPTTAPARAAAIAAATQGFVYLVSVAGVTGARGGLEARVEGLIAALKAGTDKSVAVGFGVAEPAHAAQLKAWGADGVIVGSALVRALGEAPSAAEGLAAMEALARSIRAAI
jgi:tryptophan synthase alpha subunit